MDCLHALVSIHKPDAICLWLCPDITAAEISLPGYSAARLDRDRHGGGIILFVADIYNVKVLLRLGISSCVCSVCTINKEQETPVPPTLLGWPTMFFFLLCLFSVHNLNLV